MKFCGPATAFSNDNNSASLGEPKSLLLMQRIDVARAGRTALERPAFFVLYFEAGSLGAKNNPPW
jgi:hypothetical protein